MTKSNSPAASACSATSSDQVQGVFCWHELHTRDTAAANAFYCNVIGWKAQSCGDANSSGHTYTEWNNNGKVIGGMMTMPAGVPAHVPAHWALYVNVDDVDAAVARVKVLGGTVITEPFDYPHVGRIAVIADPTGAVICLYKGLPGCGNDKNVAGAAGHFCWNELLTSDPTAAEAFYKDLIGWQTWTMNTESMPYTIWSLAGRDPHDKSACVGGMMKIPPQWGAMPSAWLVYISVDDVDAAAGRVTTHGGTVCVAPMDIPGIGRFAVCTDCTGATFALYKSTHS